MFKKKIKAKQKIENKKKISSFEMIGLGEEKDDFIENLSLLLSSGMGVLASLNSMKKEAQSKSMKKVIDSIEEDILSGSTMWKAFDQVSLFPSHIISLIRIGEESGRLSKNLRLLADQRRKDRVFRAKIRSAMMYPILVLFLALVIGIGISWFILPKLSLVFSQLKINLPLATRILIKIGIFIENHGMIFIPLFFMGMLLFFYFIFFFNKTKFIGQRIIFSFPPIKKIIKQIETARMGYLLGSLLDAGVPVVSTLKSLADATTFSFYKKIYIFLGKQIEEGNSFQKSFAAYPKLGKYIDSSVQQMIVAGEQSGNLSVVLLKISENFEEKSDSATKNLSIILEPVLLIIVWLGVVFVALAVILPIYSLIGGLNQSSGGNVSKPQTPPIETVIDSSKSNF